MNGPDVNGHDPTPAETLAALGWDERLATLLAFESPGFVPGRILTEERGQYLVATETGEGPASPSGRLRHDTELDPSATWPAVGDWVAMEPGSAGRASTHPARAPPPHRGRPARARRPQDAVPGARRERRHRVRRHLGEPGLQRPAARAIPRGRVGVGAWPVVLLSKADLADDLESYRIAATTAAPGVDVIGVSVVTGEGLDAVRAHLGPGRTVVFMGSSGVGKSSIVNALAGEPLLVTAAIREDDARGRHTTTRRELVRLAGGLLIDTPGLRELGVLDGDGVGTAFEDVERAAATCRFSDCQHRSEPGCGVRAAIAGGSLDPARLEAYRKLEREAERAALATDAIARRAERKRWATIHRSVDQHMKLKYGADR